jgi:hypothetical protein
VRNRGCSFSFGLEPTSSLEHDEEGDDGENLAAQTKQDERLPAADLANEKPEVLSEEPALGGRRFRVKL